MTTYWALRLKSFGSDAPKSLLAQHDLLQILVDAADPSLSVTIRMTARRRSEGVEVAYHLICEGNRASAGLAKTLHDVASVGLLTGYSLRTGTEAPEAVEGLRTELVPQLGGLETLPIKPDWSQVYDIVRRRGETISLDLRCRFTSSAAGPRSTARPVMLGTDAGTPALEALGGADSGSGRLSLEVTITAPKKIDRAYANAIARKLFGVACDLVALDASASPRGSIWSPNEALRVWHWPYGEIQGRGLGTFAPSLPLIAKKGSRRGSSLGTARFEGPRFDRDDEVVMGADDRMKHIYVVGKTGSGKTNLLKRLARQDIQQGKGCLVISPHADLIDHLIDTAGDRSNDIVLLDFGDAIYAPLVNPLTIDVNEASDYARAVTQLTDLVAGMNYHEFTGPVFYDAVRTAFQTAVLDDIRGQQDPSIAVAVEIVRDRTLRGWAAKVAKDARRDLELELSLISDLKSSDVSEYSRWVTAKFSDFAVNGPLRAITSGSAGSPLSFREIYQGQKILLVHLPDTYLTGESAEFIGRYIFERIYLEARRTSSGARKDFYIHADEFQRFVNRDLEVLVTEARKFRLGLTFAHQNLRQLQAFSRYEGTSSSRLAEAIFSNAGTLVAMRTSGSDVQTLATELEVPEHYVRRIAQHEALARATLGGAEERAFTLRVPLETTATNSARRSALRRRMIAEGYWHRRKTVERELDAHLQKLRELANPLPKRSAPPDNRRPRPSTSVSATGSAPPEPPNKPGSSFLEEWLANRATQRSADGQRPADRTSKGKTL
ncbi:Type IV secretion-system coupling protein DNA-binding domain-containing protein [Plantibacter sp. VKM Ac-1784]|uniref:Type IV secretion-system coupling protein DNA-binding domain-containing protein n=1 Tax=Plantibacter elymi (nom. nud.) TaxID=199708 RepID=A0ABY1R8X8_9MICO|nr:type IV secretion system DNA-binding domain-containing protein [Plantibacter sp. VKM Ac-1784]SMQ62416.1 Type IV secretion-system coupling protein DNA-binding domain-containing protein [Plantibacter sp. VKM Ac-1784]